MIGLRKQREYLDMYPGTMIQRERTSPFFIAKTSSGKDAIPGEVSFPFKLPPTDKNYRLLLYPHIMPQQKTKKHDMVLEDTGMQISAGKLVVDLIQSHLNKNNTGYIDSHFLSNSSEFYKNIENKKLSELSLGGDRAFTWAGYDRSTAGFWKHIHDTWLYDDCTDGDYVFFPIVNDRYLGATRGFMNEIRWNVAHNDVEFNPDYNVTSICPAIYVKYILLKIFEEHGYTITGAPLDDFDFKKLTMQSFYGVYWSDINWTEDIDNFPEATLVPDPLTTVTIRLAEHMPPNMQISEFIVELQKFLPIGFEVNDNTKSCIVYWLNELSAAGLKDRTTQFRPQHQLSLGEGEGINKIYGIRRNIDPVDEWLASLPSGHDDGANNSYEPEGANEYIESNISTLPMHLTRVLDYVEYGGPVNRPPTARMPQCSVEGSWKDKDGEVVEWKLRFLFYRGKRNQCNDGLLIPLGTNNVRILGSVMSGNFTSVDGNWSIAYELGNYGLIKLWENWLRVQGSEERIIGTLTMPLYEYLSLKWSTLLLINNTPWIIKKIKEQLPYPGRFDFEAVRKL